QGACSQGSLEKLPSIHGADLAGHVLPPYSGWQRHGTSRQSLCRRQLAVQVLEKPVHILPAPAEGVFLLLKGNVFEGDEMDGVAVDAAVGLSIFFKGGLAFAALDADHGMLAGVAQFMVFPGEDVNAVGVALKQFPSVFAR